MRNDRRKARRESTGRRGEDELGIRSALYIAGIILLLGVIAFFVTIMIYNNNLDKVYSDIEGQEFASAGETQKEVEEASMQIGKSVQEVEEGNIEEEEEENEDEVEETSTNNLEEDVKENVQNETKVVDTSNEVENKEEEKEEEAEKDPEFIVPVEGTLMKEYAKENLVYSETLKEWVVHTGVDIKADKTSIVKAAEKGKVIAIKNDPRYGTTVIIEHANGFETRYANLLTAEFVTVGEEVEKGQTIGTVGNTAAFEILDDYHLHFEILKDGEYQAPELFISL